MFVESSANSINTGSVQVKGSPAAAGNSKAGKKSSMKLNKTAALAAKSVKNPFVL